MVARLVWLVASAIAVTLRFRWEDESGLFQPGANQRVICAIWHNRLAIAPIIYRRHVTRRLSERGNPRTMACLVSASRDGALLARIIELFNCIPVRGSSSRRGAAALRELATLAAAGSDLAITPDGPRGPKYEVQDGVIAAAQLTGLPIVPASYHTTWKTTLKSWDRFQIPLPFGCVTVRVGRPLWVSAEAGEIEREASRQVLQARLRALTFD